jgi:hypothetical protein
LIQVAGRNVHAGLRSFRELSLVAVRPMIMTKLCVRVNV